MQPLVTLQPMIHVEDMAASIALYKALGAEPVHSSRDRDFALLHLGATQFSLLTHPANPEQNEGTVEMNFEANVPLEQIIDALHAAGVDPITDPTEESFGRGLQITAPDGLLLKINEMDPVLYT